MTRIRIMSSIDHYSYLPAYSFTSCRTYSEIQTPTDLPTFSHPPRHRHPPTSTLSPHVTPHVEELLNGSRNAWPPAPSYTHLPASRQSPARLPVPLRLPCMPGSEAGAPSPCLVGWFVLVTHRSHHRPDTRTPVSTPGVGLG